MVSRTCATSVLSGMSDAAEEVLGELRVVEEEDEGEDRHDDRHDLGDGDDRVDERRLLDARRIMKWNAQMPTSDTMMAVALLPSPKMPGKKRPSVEPISTQ